MLDTTKYENKLSYPKSISEERTEYRNLLVKDNLSPAQKLRIEELKPIVDEFDAFYHSKTAEDVFVLLKKLKQQVIVTTHNTNLLDHRFTRADCCFEIGNSSIKSFADRTQREIRAGNNLEKLYLAGEFDA